MNILFICTHNRCRSLLSEAITKKLGKEIINAASAGSAPAEKPHPLTLKYLNEAGYDTADLFSKSWNDLGDFLPDIVVTVCDSAAGESCPLWLGPVPKVHWGLPDPSSVKGSDAEIAAAFHAVIKEIESRINQLLEHNISKKSTEEVVALMKTIAEKS